MSKINTNIPSLVAQSNLVKSGKELSLRFERLSTGLRINRGADDPAGLIISERLRSDIQGVESGIKNSERASSVISTTEAALSEVSDLLNSIKSLIVEAANTGANSAEERAANQLQIDSAIESITRISNTASFAGQKILNGTLDYLLSGVRSSAITKAQVWNASLVGAPSLQVAVDVVASAQTGGLYYNGATTPAGVLLSAMTVEVQGNRGVQTLTFASGVPLSSVVAAVNSYTTLTGVRAQLINNNPTSGLVFKTAGYGSESFVSVKRLNGPTSGDSLTLYKLENNTTPPDTTPFPWAALIGANTLVQGSRDTGQDVSALVNGNLATGRGLALSVNGPALSVELTLSEDFATRPDAANSIFQITGGGAMFQLGQQVNPSQQTNMGIPSMAASRLGGRLVSGTLQFLSSLKSGQGNSIAENVARRDFTAASDILDQAIQEVAILRGRLGAFERDVLQTNVRSLQSAFENLTASSSQIRDADFASETSRLTRAQILQSSGTTVLGLANQQAQQVLQLLG
ncbi:MAG: flagellin [Phycisphaeraceae bacterium]|nr:MAG: flagellin [Phycisphaeraceae bacterium]